MHPLCVIMSAVFPGGIAAAADWPSRVPELKAGHWYNNPVFKIHDERDVLLFFFVVDDSPMGKESLRYVEALNRLSRSPDLVVIGLSSQPRAAVVAFIEKAKVRFTVGATSSSAKDYRITRFPALVRIPRPVGEVKASPSASEAAWTRMELAELERWASDLGTTDDAGAPKALDLAAMSVEELKAFCASDALGMDRATAVRLLFQALPREDFIKLAAERLKTEQSPWPRNSLRYYMDVASGARQDDDRQSPSAAAANAYRANPDAPEWSKVKKYIDSESRASFDAMWEAYQTHCTDDPADVLVRRMAVEDMWHKCEDQESARFGLLQALTADVDPSIRMIAAMALGERCVTGDVEAADIIDRAARSEPELLRTKPMMEFVAENIRKGIDPTKIP